MSVRIVLWIVFLWLGAAGTVFGATCRAPELTFYKNDDPKRVATEFSPEDRICLAVRCPRLPAGHYIFHVEWINPGGKLQEQSEWSFEQPALSNYTLRAWLRLLRESAGRRVIAATTDSGHRMVLLGRWTVIIYLNGDRIAEAAFEVR